MFTGLVETAGRIVRFGEGTGGYRLEIDHGGHFADTAEGDSIAVNGCCLTAVGTGGQTLSFDLLAETVRRTGFAGLGEGNRVNLERSLLPTTRMGGHFVSGHIDGTGRVEVFERRGDDYYLRVAVPEDGRRYLAPKGSIALDGVSLTVAEAGDEGFAVWLIPHTLAVTNLGERCAGDPVNLEYDLIAKYVERRLESRAPGGVDGAGEGVR